MPSERFASLGRIASTHGLNGEVFVAGATEASLCSVGDAQVWIVPPPEGVRVTSVTSMRSGPKGLIVTLADIAGLDAASMLVGRELLVESDRLEIPEPEESSEGLFGYRVTDQDRGLLGEVTGVIITGANDVLEVDGPFGEVLIPVIDDVIIDVDAEAGSITVRLLPGLLEDGEE